MDPIHDAPVFINGTGLTTVQGLDVESNWTNLLAGRVLHQTGIVPLARDITLPRVSQLAIHAAKQAHAAAGSPSLKDGRTALIIGTSKGPIEDWIDQLNGKRPPNITLGIAQVAADVAIAFEHANGPRLTLSSACASGLLALIRAVDLIRKGTCDRALVVAAEASTHALFEANFRRLGVLATNEEGCRPFDENRRGFLLAEAAAAVMVSRTGQPGDVAITHTASFADATHLTGPDPTAAALTHALSSFGDVDVDLVHAHGTGTLQNDPAELLAIHRTLARHRRPAIYSHKHAIGHTQGAAGLLGTVINVEAHRRNAIPPNSNTPLPMANLGRVQAGQPDSKADVQASGVLAAGFGGTTAAIGMKTTS
ncbi:MAG: 3-oxoacyl-(acyl carrier protein) synthase [Phycisphaerales bacterium]|nr:3-oxoacyl-(acyl carrier protein) synthase [Phycisphaerales bacterium]